MVKRMNTPTKRDSTILNVSKMNFEGWLGYRDLAKKDPRYKHVSKQEFGHMLLAIQDLLQYIYEETRENPEERQELYNFIHMIKG